jgi:ATP-dependent Clp protease, protease subunit
MNTLVLEETEHGKQPMDVWQKLADNRVLFISDFLSDEVATDITATLLLKDQEDPNRKITLFINVDGGDIRNAFMIYDIMQIIECPVETVCIGSAIDEAVIILAGGTKGLRFATKNAIISVSQLSNNFMTHTNLTDANGLMEQLNKDNNRLLEILAKTSNKSVKKIKQDFDRRVFMTPTQALKYQFIDKVILPKGGSNA